MGRPRNPRQHELVAKRREEVARLAARRLTVRQIAEQIIDPDTGAPYSHMTIARDLEALKQEWRESASEVSSEVFASQLAEVRAARDECWKKGDMMGVWRFMDQEIKLTGTAAPDKLEMSGGLNMTWRDIVEDAKRERIDGDTG